jgi:predicted translin family RNA/ssDNA-binding protein
LIENIDDIGQEIRDYFDSADRTRETLLTLARQVTRASAETLVPIEE